MPRSLAALLALLLPLAVHADTALRFEAPRVLGESGKRVGEAKFETEKLASGGLRLSAITRLDSGAGSETEAVLALALDARVANTPVQLLLRPLATTSQREIEVDVVVCRGAPRLMTMRGKRKGTSAWPQRPHVVEVEYGPTGFLGALAGLVAPRISFWFDPSAAAPWIAHRIRRC